MSSDVVSIILGVLSLFVSLTASMYFYFKSMAQSKFQIMSEFCKGLPLKHYGKLKDTWYMWRNLQFVREKWPERYKSKMTELIEEDKLKLLYGVERSEIFSLDGYEARFSKEKSTFEILRIGDVKPPSFD